MHVQVSDLLELARLGGDAGAAPKGGPGEYCSVAQHGVAAQPVRAVPKPAGRGEGADFFVPNCESANLRCASCGSPGAARKTARKPREPTRLVFGFAHRKVIFFPKRRARLGDATYVQKSSLPATSSLDDPRLGLPRV